jgi:hypothetical protein
MGRKLAAALVGVVAVLGLRFYNKASAHDDVRGRLVQLCAEDAECLAAVGQHYEACFDASYKMGGRRTSSRLDQNALVRCVNTKSGVPYFAVGPERK